jgi:hypothetical protein
MHTPACNAWQRQGLMEVIDICTRLTGAHIRILVSHGYLTKYRIAYGDAFLIRDAESQSHVMFISGDIRIM